MYSSRLTRPIAYANPSTLLPIRTANSTSLNTSTTPFVGTATSVVQNVTNYTSPTVPEALYWPIATDISWSQRSNTTSVSTASQCWDQVATWMNQSASWYNAHVASRTWEATTTSVPFATCTSYVSSTVYPNNVSLTTLCDGTPRADASPSTVRTLNVSTDVEAWTNLVGTSTYSIPAPSCFPETELAENGEPWQQHMCRIWFDDSNIQNGTEGEWLLHRRCSDPAHADGPCIFGGGPVQLIYFPVPTMGANQCDNNWTTLSATPTGSGSNVITTLGTTFTSGSVHLSFDTLYAYYDGFTKDPIGPTLTNSILPLRSDEVFTQCPGVMTGGVASIFGGGQSMDYADLNWPVPASAYDCANRCSGVSQCNTIWNGFNRS